MSGMVSIPPISTGIEALGRSVPHRSRSSQGTSFAGELAGAMERIENGNTESAEMIGRFLRGDNVELHTVALRAQETQASFELFLQVRNKLIQGYQEIMRLQI